MVSRNIIEKTIENILTIKCKVNRIGTNSLNNNIKGGLNRFAEETKDLTHERVQLLDNKGNVLLEEDGDENHVSWNSIEALQYQQGDLINEHNHPTPFIQSNDKTFELSTCLSDRDVNNLWKVDTIGFSIIFLETIRLNKPIFLFYLFHQLTFQQHLIFYHGLFLTFAFLFYHQTSNP